MKSLLAFFIVFMIGVSAESQQGGAPGQGPMQQTDPNSVPLNPPKGVDPLTETDDSEEVEIPTWSCRVDSQPKEAGFTVGEKFVLICEGQSVQFGDSKKIHFQMPEASLYAIKVLSVDRVKSSEILLTATSYLKGQHKLQELVLVQDLEEKARIRPFNLQVSTVIEDPKQKPFPPLGAFRIRYPFWFWLSLISLLIFGLCYGIFRLQRRAKRLKVLEELKRHNTALGPYYQLNKDLRNLTREYSFAVSKKWDSTLIERYVVSLDEIFRMYLLREFIVPALDWKTNLVMKEINRSDKTHYSAYGVPLKKLLKELDRARQDVDKVDKGDCLQLTQIARKVSQSIWQQRRNRVSR